MISLSPHLSSARWFWYPGAASSRSEMKKLRTCMIFFLWLKNVKSIGHLEWNVHRKKKLFIKRKFCLTYFLVPMRELHRKIWNSTASGGHIPKVFSPRIWDTDEQFQVKHWRNGKICPSDIIRAGEECQVQLAWVHKSLFFTKADERFLVKQWKM